MHNKYQFIMLQKDATNIIYTYNISSSSQLMTNYRGLWTPFLLELTIKFNLYPIKNKLFVDKSIDLIP